jgi:hypothetical protein
MKLDATWRHAVIGRAGDYLRRSFRRPKSLSKKQQPTQAGFDLKEFSKEI